MCKSMSRTRPTFLAVAIALLAAGSQAFADGGVVIGEKAGEGLHITVFAQPVPLHAGPADFSVLVQDDATRQPVMDADVRLSLKKLSAPSLEKAWTAPYCQLPGTDGDVLLRRDLAQNKMLYAIMVGIAEAGRWELSVRAASGGRRVAAILPLDVAPPCGALLTWWPAIAVLPCMIALYIWRAALLRARRRKFAANT